MTIQDLRAIAATIDRPESAPEMIIAKAERALRAHPDPASPLDVALRAARWCDTDVRECVGAVRQAIGALQAAE